MEIERILICRPKGSMCMSCVHIKEDCSHLNFNEMMPIAWRGDFVEVLCSEHKRRKDESYILE